MSKAEEQKQTAPEEIQLEEVELLRLENLKLKMVDAQRTLAGLQAELGAEVERVHKRLGIANLQDYSLNSKTGKGQLVRKIQPKGA